ncbi:4-(cytidine 5'-diphospho)-2-C-methyl-D-erythritol kinase [Novosphingobium sp. ZN18A2]|uniref:4-(cytidine 5'-diphospho)-2-C-methyl-D-erythritol kinase n=1 Tax=Novosphingobium sp. ZN18A2 TaxID=3079861 RepID=UPI0030D41DFC
MADRTGGGRICKVARAKLNLALHVRARRADGYHDLDSVFVHCVDGDEMWAEPADALSLTITGPFGNGLSTGEDNLVMRAARAVSAEYGGDRGAAITLVKNLPLASGIGGGSADAAAAIRLLVSLWDLPDDPDRMSGIAATLGADVAPCLFSWPKHVIGRGEHFTRLGDAAYRDWPVVLVNPGVEVSTGAIFREWDGRDRGGLGDTPRFADVMASGRNDLEAPARALATAIGDAIDALAAQPGAFGARMSGSGATCFALFGSCAERDAAGVAIRRAHPDWWVMETRLS